MPDDETTPSTSSHYRTFRRSRDERMVAGVCGGAATYLDVDAPLLRVVVAAAVLLGFVPIVAIYLVCWLLVPEQ
jgi:phage shock protein C